MCCVSCVLRYGVCWSLSFSLYPLSYLCGALYNMIVHVHVHCTCTVHAGVGVKTFCYGTWNVETYRSRATMKNPARLFHSYSVH